MCAHPSQRRLIHSFSHESLHSNESLHLSALLFERELSLSGRSRLARPSKTTMWLLLLKPIKSLLISKLKWLELSSNSLVRCE